MIALSVSVSSFAQEQPSDLINTVVRTGAPFLRIAPDARAGGLADQGVATTSDAFSQFWNPAKYTFSNTTSAVGLSYTPYLSSVASDIFLLYGSFATFLDSENRSTLSTSIYYFNMGEVRLTNLNAATGAIEENGIVKPNEFSLDVAYGLKLSDTYSMAVKGKFVRSDLGGSFGTNSTIQAANSFAVDVSGYYQGNKHETFGGYEGRARGGFAVQNIGPKLDYSGDESSRAYLPTMGRLGAGYDLYFDEQNRLGLTGEVSKLLVPGPDATSGIIPDIGVIEGIGRSFSNKKSLMYSVAGEYEYDKSFAVRGGYFYESPEQGARNFASVGVGLKYSSFGFDASYLVNLSKVNTALDNTLRFGITWNIGQNLND